MSHSVSDDVPGGVSHSVSDDVPGGVSHSISDDVPGFFPTRGKMSAS